MIKLLVVLFVLLLGLGFMTFWDFNIGLIVYALGVVIAIGVAWDGFNRMQASDDR